MSPGGTTRKTTSARPESTPRWSRPTPSTSITSLPAHGTTGSDSDWVVKLIDVYPEDYQKITEEDATKGAGPVLNGYELMVAGDILRGRYRNSLDTPEPITPDQVTEYKIDLHPNDHVFLKGHRIMVQVQSTWFPVYDRNPQKFVDNIYKATDADYVKATQKIYGSKDSPSSVLLPVTSH